MVVTRFILVLDFESFLVSWFSFRFCYNWKFYSKRLSLNFLCFWLSHFALWFNFRYDPSMANWAIFVSRKRLYSNNDGVIVACKYMSLTCASYFVIKFWVYSLLCCSSLMRLANARDGEFHIMSCLYFYSHVLLLHTNIWHGLCTLTLWEIYRRRSRRGPLNSKRVMTRVLWTQWVMTKVKRPCF